MLVMNSSFVHFGFKGLDEICLNCGPVYVVDESIGFIYTYAKTGQFYIANGYLDLRIPESR